MNMITATLQRAWSDISGFLLIIVIMLVAYSTAVSVLPPFAKTRVFKDPGQEYFVSLRGLNNTTLYLFTVSPGIYCLI